MASTTMQKVTVQELSKFGFKANNQYVNWSKHVKDADKGLVVPGGTYDMEVFTADSGKQYVNKVLTSATAGAPPIVAPVFAKTPIAKAAPKSVASDSMSKDEWAAKDVRISRQGCIQAAVNAVAPLVSLEKLMPEAEKLADLMLAYVNRK